MQRFPEEFSEEEAVNDLLIIAAKHAEKLLRDDGQLNSHFYEWMAESLNTHFKTGLQLDFSLIDDGRQMDLWKGKT